MRSKTPNKHYKQSSHYLPKQNTLQKNSLYHSQEQLIGYVNDLENSLSINKRIISELLSDNKEGNNLKRAVYNLNKENAILQEKLKITIKEKERYQNELLIAQQAINALKYDEALDKEELKDRIGGLITELNKKECRLQITERNLLKAAGILKKYSLIDGEIKNFLSKLDVDKDTEITITNIVEQNKILNNKLHEAKKDIDRLEKWLNVIAGARSKYLTNENTLNKQKIDAVESYKDININLENIMNSENNKQDLKKVHIIKSCNNLKITESDIKDVAENREIVINNSIECLSSIRAEVLKDFLS